MTRDRSLINDLGIFRTLIVLGFLSAFLSGAGLSAKPTGKMMLTPEEAQDGWVSLFDGESLFGWDVFGDGDWQVADGNIVCEEGRGGWLASSAQFADFELLAKVRVAEGLTSALVVRAGLEGHPGENGTGVVPLTAVAGEPQWREVRVVAQGDSVRARVGQGSVWVTAARKVGHIGFHLHTYSRKPRNRVEVAWIKLRPLGLQSIFNGNDLSEWNVLPGRKSKFAVIDGALNIKNGVGQIETAGVYKDFVLQLDVFSNGKQLNSGVFFRGTVGRFWHGYESQVRNHWDGDDRNRPVDFGTGGNYGNQPARRVVSSDHEWFRKTIICNGGHTSVWVNGYLTSDYLDMRPPSAKSDGKRGYIPGPGTIHLQGHDPKTDLSFKNIRIAEYHAGH